MGPRVGPAQRGQETGSGQARADGPGTRAYGGRYPASGDETVPAGELAADAQQQLVGNQVAPHDGVGSGWGPGKNAARSRSASARAWSSSAWSRTTTSSTSMTDGSQPHAQGLLSAPPGRGRGGRPGASLRVR